MKVNVISLALKRISYLIVAVLVGVVAPQLMTSAPFDWNAVVEDSKVALGYWIVTTFRDFQDPSIPNSPRE